MSYTKYRRIKINGKKAKRIRRDARRKAGRLPQSKLIEAKTDTGNTVLQSNQTVRYFNKQLKKRQQSGRRYDNRE